MKLIVLGCWAPYPSAGGACSGYLIQSKGKNILVECGNGVVSNLLKYIDFRKLDAVLISHLHPDHYLDLYCLRHAIGGARRLEPELPVLPVYMPDEPAEPFTKLKSFNEAFTVFPIEELSTLSHSGIEIRETKIGENTIRFTKTDHPLPSYSIIIEGEGKLFYSADTKWTSSLPVIASGADVVLCEASIIEEDREYASIGHLTCLQAGELGRLAGAGRLVATHFWPEYDLETIKTEVESGFNGPVILAQEGLQVTIK